MVKVVQTPMPEQLAAARKDVDDAAAALVDARRRRDALVREAVDTGQLSQREAGKAAGITGPRVAAILATPEDDDQ